MHFSSPPFVLRAKITCIAPSVAPLSGLCTPATDVSLVSADGSWETTLNVSVSLPPHFCLFTLLKLSLVTDTKQALQLIQSLNKKQVNNYYIARNFYSHKTLSLFIMPVCLSVRIEKLGSHRSFCVKTYIGDFFNKKNCQASSSLVKIRKKCQRLPFNAQTS